MRTCEMRVLFRLAMRRSRSPMADASSESERNSTRRDTPLPPLNSKTCPTSNRPWLDKLPGLLVLLMLMLGLGLGLGFDKLD